MRACVSACVCARVCVRACSCLHRYYLCTRRPKLSTFAALIFSIKAADYTFVCDTIVKQGVPLVLTQTTETWEREMFSWDWLQQNHGGKYSNTTDYQGTLNFVNKVYRWRILQETIFPLRMRVGGRCSNILSISNSLRRIVTHLDCTVKICPAQMNGIQWISLSVPATKHLNALRSLNECP
jgi:hypothetical protein